MLRHTLRNRRAEARDCGRLARALPAGIASLVLAVAPAGQAAAAARDLFAGLVPMTGDDLAANRAGMKIAGFNVNLGATVRATIDGHTVLETVATFDAGKFHPTHTTPNLAGLPPGLQSLKLIGGNSGGGSHNVAVNGNTVSVPQGLTGVVVSTETGTTAALQKLAQDQIANIAISTDPGRQVEQHLTIDITVSGIDALQLRSQLNALVSRVTSSVRNGVVDGMRR